MNNSSPRLPRSLSKARSTVSTGMLLQTLSKLPLLAPPSSVADLKAALVFANKTGNMKVKEQIARAFQRCQSTIRQSVIKNNLEMSRKRWNSERKTRQINQAKHQQQEREELRRRRAEALAERKLRQFREQQEKCLKREQSQQKYSSLRVAKFRLQKQERRIARQREQQSLVNMKFNLWRVMKQKTEDRNAVLNWGRKASPRSGRKQSPKTKTSQHRVRGEQEGAELVWRLQQNLRGLAQRIVPRRQIF